MTHNEIMDAFEERTVAAEKAMQMQEFRQAASIFRDVSGAYTEIAMKDSEAPDVFLAGMAHFYGAKAFLASCSAGEQEQASPSMRNRDANEVVKFARKGIQSFQKCGHGGGQVLCYGVLIDGLMECIKSTRDTEGIARVEDELMDAIHEYRDICPPGQGKQNLLKLMFVQASIAQTEGTRLLLQEYNTLASQAYFKKSRGYLDAARSLAQGLTDVLSKVDENERQGRGMSYFGEGYVLQERGTHAEAVKRFRQAEEELMSLDSAIDRAFARWSAAARHFNAALDAELRGDYATSIREFHDASEAYAIAADCFPNTDQIYYTNAAKMRFYADSCNDRAKSVLSRSSDFEARLHKGRRTAGLLFFALWVISAGGMIAGLKYLSQSINGIEFITIVAITFVASMVAAALIRPEEAMQFLGSLGLGRRQPPAAHTPPAPARKSKT